jgi:dienelactone hydrolase
VARPSGVLVAVAVAVVVATLPGAARAGQSRVTDARYAVGLRVLELEDRSRATPADPKGQTPVAASRTRALPTDVYYPAAGAPADPESRVAVPDAPAADGRFPLILFSHGSPGDPVGYASLLERWAAEGYVVVAPTYPVSSSSGPTKVTARDQREQVRDARFVLDRVLALDRRPVARGGLDGLLRRKRIAAAGHSMGGLTTLALVSDCCRDRRVKAAVVLAGVAENGDGGPGIRDPAGPILFAHATLDFAVPYRESERTFAAAGRPKYLLEIRFPIGGVLAHLIPFASGLGQISTSVAGVVDDFLAGYLRRDRAARAEIPAVARSDRFLKLRFRD